MLDINTLLDPIRPEAPCGPDLRLAQQSTSLSRAREFRRQEDPVRAADPTRPKVADWTKLVDACAQGLEHDSKDLELAAYLTEGLARTAAFPGLEAGLRLVGGLVERYWDNLHPHALDGEPAPQLRLKFLHWLGASEGIEGFLTTVAAIPLTGVGSAGRPFALADHEDAVRLEEAARTAASKYKDMVEAKKTTMEQWRAALAATTAERRSMARLEVEACGVALRTLTNACAAKCGADAPSFASLESMLQRILDLLAPGSTGSDPPSDPAEAAVPGSEVRGAVRSRGDAVRQLREVAAFLRSTEPHSPVSFLIERSVKWLSMPFDALLEDYVESEQTRKSIRALLGIESDQNDK